MNKLFQSTLVTDLGEVACSLFSESNRCEIEENQASIIVKTSGHICELIELEIDNKWIPKDMSIEQSKGWLWKIRKSKPKPEKLGIECKMNPGCKVTSERAAGEYLDCIAIESKEKEVLIGTEDPEALLHRSERSDYMPSRFSKVPDNFNGIVFVNYIQFGFEALLPVLYEEEELYIHFLCAANSIKKSISYPDEQDVQTWYAVGHTKNEILKWSGVKFNS